MSDEIQYPSNQSVVHLVEARKNGRIDLSIGKAQAGEEDLIEMFVNWLPDDQYLGYGNIYRLWRQFWKDINPRK